MTLKAAEFHCPAVDSEQNVPYMDTNSRGKKRRLSGAPLSRDDIKSDRLPGQGISPKSNQSDQMPNNEDSALALRPEDPGDRKRRLGRERQQRRRQKLKAEGLTTRGTEPLPETQRPVHGCVVCGRPIAHRRRHAYCSKACNVQSVRIRRRFPEIRTYEGIREKSFELRANHAALKEQRRLKREEESRRGFWDQLALRIETNKKRIAQERLEFKGPKWTLELEAEFWRWCDWRTRFFRFYRAFLLPGSLHPDPLDATITAYDACAADLDLENLHRIERLSARRNACLHLPRALRTKELIEQEVEACVPRYLIQDFWKPRIWRTHPYRAEVDREEWKELYPDGKPSIADFIPKARKKLSVDRLNVRGMFDQLMWELMDVKALPPSQQTALPTFRMEDHPAMRVTRVGLAPDSAASPERVTHLA